MILPFIHAELCIITTYNMLSEKHSIAPYLGICDRVQQGTYLEAIQASQIAIEDIPAYLKPASTAWHSHRM